MRNKMLFAGVLLSIFTSVIDAQMPTDETGDGGVDIPTEEETKPELRRRSLPDDTFKPSEEVSEDYPVPFPVDI